MKSTLALFALAALLAAGFSAQAQLTVDGALGADSRLSYPVAGASAPVSVVAYNTLGQPALTLLDGATQPAGEHLLHGRAGDQLSTQRVVVR